MSVPEALFKASTGNRSFVRSFRSEQDSMSGVGARRKLRSKLSGWAGASGIAGVEREQVRFVWYPSSTGDMYRSSSRLVHATVRLPDWNFKCWSRLTRISIIIIIKKWIICNLMKIIIEEITPKYIIQIVIDNNFKRVDKTCHIIESDTLLTQI